MRAIISRSQDADFMLASKRVCRYHASIFRSLNSRRGPVVSQSLRHALAPRRLFHSTPGARKGYCNGFVRHTAQDAANRVLPLTHTFRDVTNSPNRGLLDGPSPGAFPYASAKVRLQTPVIASAEPIKVSSVPPTTPGGELLTIFASLFFATLSLNHLSSARCCRNPLLSLPSPTRFFS